MQPPLPGLKVWRANRDSAPARCEPNKRTGLVTHDHGEGRLCGQAIEPARARRALADRLARMDLGAGHIGHIPSHIYYRVGRNKDSLAVDKKAARQTRPISRSEAEVIAALSRDTVGRRSSPGPASRTNAANLPEARARQPGTPAHLPELDLKAGRFFEDGAELDLACRSDIELSEPVQLRSCIGSDRLIRGARVLFDPDPIRV